MHQFNQELLIVQGVIAHPTQSVRGAVTMALITNNSAGSKLGGHITLGEHSLFYHLPPGIR